MGKPPLNLAEDSIMAYRIKKCSQKTNGISFWAFLFSIFIYISVFYSFNQPPSALFYSTKFWFIISNTLILIIAADSGAFSSSEEKEDLSISSQGRSSASSFISQCPEIVKNSSPDEVHASQQNKQIIVHESKIPETKLEIVVNSEKPTNSFQDKLPGFGPEADNEAPEEGSDDENSKIILCSSEANRQEPCEEESEFSTMSDEELNRRVEEFIRKFNRQIRLQAFRQL